MSNYCFGNEISFLFSVPNKYMIIAGGGISSYPKISPRQSLFAGDQFSNSTGNPTSLFLWCV